MRDLISRFRELPRAADDGGSAGKAAPAGVPPADAAAPPASAAAPAQAADGPPPPAGPYFPENFPEQLRGQNDRETIDKAWKALDGYRQKEARRDVPEQPEGYLRLEGLKDFAVADDFRPYFDQLAADPVFRPMAERAKELGLGRREFLDLWQTGMAGLKNAGMLEPVLDPAAERAALLPDAARSLPKAEQDKAIDRRMKENYDFLDLMTANGGLDKAAREHAELMLGDSAKGHLFLEWVRGRLQSGSGQQPGAHGAAGGHGDTAESLRAEMRKPELTPGHPSFDREKYQAFEARYRKFHAGG